MRTDPIDSTRSVGVRMIVSRNQINAILKFQCRLRVSFKGCEIYHEIVLDSKYRVSCKVWVIFGKDLCCDRLVIVVTYLDKWQQRQHLQDLGRYLICVLPTMR